MPGSCPKIATLLRMRGVFPPGRKKAEKFPPRLKKSLETVLPEAGSRWPQATSPPQELGAGPSENIYFY
jgi:hypothetical protein